MTTDRLPAATEYRVEVPAGTTAANGATLADAVAWTFSTPAPRVTAFVGESDSLPLEPVFVAVFDQRVDPAAVLDTITLEAAGQRVGLRLASAAEIDADDAARAAHGNALPDRAVAFRAAEPLPVDADLTITIGPGTPSRRRTAHERRAVDVSRPHLRSAARRQQPVVRTPPNACPACRSRSSSATPSTRSRSTPGS